MRESRLFKSIEYFALVVSLFLFIGLASADSITVNEPTNICGEDHDLTPQSGLYDEITINDTVTVCGDGAVIESNNLIDVTSDGAVNGTGENSGDGADFNVSSDEISSIGDFVSRGESLESGSEVAGDGGRIELIANSTSLGGSNLASGGDNSEGDGGEGGALIIESSEEELDIAITRLFARGGDADEDTGTGGDGGNITLRYTTVDKGFPETLLQVRGGDGDTQGEEGEEEELTTDYIITDSNFDKHTVPGETVEAEATVENQGEFVGLQNVIYRVDSVEEDSEDAEIGLGNSKQLNFNYTVDKEAGEYDLEIDTQDEFVTPDDLNVYEALDLSHELDIQDANFNEYTLTSLKENEVVTSEQTSIESGEAIFDAPNTTYDYRMRAEYDSTFLQADFKNNNPDQETFDKQQTILTDYTVGAPDKVDEVGEVFAFQSDIEFGETDITFPKTVNIEFIIECSNWDFSSDDCAGDWETNSLSEYQTSENSTHLTITVNEFSAYGTASEDKQITLETQEDWNEGEFNRTSADRNDNSGNLGLGYHNATNPAINTQQPGKNNLLGYWRLDEGSDPLKDFSGNGLDGTNSGGTLGVDGSLSTPGANFDTDERVVVDEGEDLVSGPEGDLTVSLWVKPDQLQEDFQAFLWNGPSQDDGWQIYTSSSNDDSVAIAVNENGETDVLREDGVLTDNEWNHIVGSYDDSEQLLRLYVNGDPVESGSLVNAEGIGDHSDQLEIGSETDFGLPALATIDEVMVIGERLTDEEVEQLYFDGKDGVLEGKYSYDFSYESTTQLNSLDTLSTVPADTSVSLTVRSIDGGTVLDSDTVNLGGGDEVNQLDLETSDEYELEIDGDTLNEEETWEIESLTVDAESSGFAVAIDSTNSPLPDKGTLEVDAAIENLGSEEETQDIELDFDGSTVNTESVTLTGGEETVETLTYDTSSEDDGEYPITVKSNEDEDSDEVTVGEIENFEVDITNLEEDTFSDEFVVTAEIENTGDGEGTQLTNMTFEGEQEDTQEVTLEKGEITEETYIKNLDGELDDGRYDVEVISKDDRDEDEFVKGDYTQPSGDTTDIYMSEFQLAEISNQNTEGDTTDAEPSYLDFTEDEDVSKAILEPGEVYTVTMEASVNNPVAPENFFNIFADWNRNVTIGHGTRQDIGNCENECSVQGDITVPQDAEPGQTRLRAFLKEGEYKEDPTTDYTEGQTHDYLVEVQASEPDQLEIDTQPEDSSLNEPVEGPPTVVVRDENNNVVQDENIDIDAELIGGSFSSSTTTVNTDGDGTAVFDDLEVSDQGDYEIEFDTDNLDPVTSQTFSVEERDNLEIQTQPGDSIVEEIISPSPEVLVEDSNGNELEGEDVIVSLNESSFSSGTTTQTTDSTGIAEFDDLVISETGDYKMTFELESDSAVNEESTDFSIREPLPRITTQQDWNQGEYTRTSADRNDNSGNLGLGYHNATNPAINTQQPGKNNLLGYWRLDRETGDFIDYSGNNLDGTGQGPDGGPNRGQTGMLSTDAPFFTDGNYVEINEGENLISGPEGDLTVSFWVKPDALTDQFQSYLWNGPDLTDGWQIYSRDGGEEEQLTWAVRNSDGDTELLTTGNVLQENQWFHVAATYESGSGNMQIYVNGNSEGTGTGPDSIGDHTDDFEIGYSTDQDDIAEANIDEVKVIGEELTEAEVEELYFQGMDDVWEGEYSRNFSDETQPEAFSLDTVSTVPADTEVDVGIRSIDGGTVLESDSISLEGGEEENAVSVQASEDFELFIEGNTTNVEDSWVIEELNITESAFLSVEEFETLNEVAKGDTFNPNVTVENTGGLSDQQTVEYIVDGNVEDSETVDLEPGEFREVEFEYTADKEIGEYTQSVETEDDSKEENLKIEESDFQVEIIDTNSPVTEDEDNEILEIDAEIDNVGNIGDTQDIDFFINDTFNQSEERTLSDGESTVIEFTEDISNLEDDEEFPVKVESEDDSDEQTVVKGESAFFEAEVIAFDEQVDEGEIYNLTGEFTNVGGQEGTKNVGGFWESGTTIDLIFDVTLGPGESTTREFEYDPSAEGEDTGRYDSFVSTDDEQSDTVEVLFGQPPEFDVNITDVDNQNDEDLVVEADIENLGDVNGTQDVEMEFEGSLVDTNVTELDGGELKTIILEHDISGEPDGIYDILVSTDDNFDTAETQIGGYEPIAGNTDFEYLTEFEVEDPSTGDSLLLNQNDLGNTQDSLPGFLDFTEDGEGLGDEPTEEASTPQLERGEQYTITMVSELNDGSDFDHFFNIFTDWDQEVQLNSDNRAEDQIGSCNTGDTGCSVTADITVPSDAELGETRVRSILRFDGYQDDPQQDVDFGQAHDYNFEVVDDNFQINEFERKDEVFETEEVRPNATILNVGGAEGTQTVEYKIDGTVVDSETVTIEAESQETVNYEHTIDRAPGTYDHSVETEDDSQTEALEIKPAPELEVSQIHTEDGLVEGEDGEVKVEIEETENENVEDSFDVELRNERIDTENEWNLIEEKTEREDLDAGETKNVTFHIEFDQGPNRLTAEVDPKDEVIEKQGENNVDQIIEDVSSYNIFFGGTEKTLKLGADQDDFTSWFTQEPAGNVFFADTDSDFEFGDLDAPDEENDLATADEALEISNHNDSIEDEWDEAGDGFADETKCFDIADEDVCNVPVVDSTNTEDFRTGILYDNPDGTSYEASDDLIFVTESNPDTEGEFGVYDYEIKVPSNLEIQAGGTEQVTIYTELE